MGTLGKNRNIPGPAFGEARIKREERTYGVGVAGTDVGGGGNVSVGGGGGGGGGCVSVGVGGCVGFGLRSSVVGVAEGRRVNKGVAVGVSVGVGVDEGIGVGVGGSSVQCPGPLTPLL